ncbi:serpin family protein [Actinokineospora globicatena]|uniref:Serine protease n=1 Tax=Actinokineospora globicatena TaxID=103729 RepID=A0A9W6QRU5_9PSEU|nr:serpin family protein [Actinokineospora globicatena]GLW93643.1 serine protease [Actinokineospora globicatena]
MSHLDFTLALHRAIALDPTQQVCWSPFSAASALTLLARGARGTTQAELRALLGDLDELGAALGAAGTLSEVWEGQPEPTLAVANTLWADAVIDIEPGFADLFAGSGGVRNAPFQAEPTKARDQINADIAETTRGLIPDLLPPDVITADTVSILVNALYLKTSWEGKFTPDESPSPFTGARGTVDVPTMYLDKQLPYAARDGWQVVGIPALGGVQAVVLLPDGDLGPAEAALTTESLGALLADLDWMQVGLRLPKLDVSTQSDLTEALNDLGVTTVFSDQADLSGISPDPLYAQAVLHESVLRVDEQGLEGAAATAVAMALTAVATERVDVTVDRPFLLLVRHRDTGVVYFVARVTNPA